MMNPGWVLLADPERGDRMWHTVAGTEHHDDGWHVTAVCGRVVDVDDEPRPVTAPAGGADVCRECAVAVD
jgi:hypothetical protein